MSDQPKKQRGVWNPYILAIVAWIFSGVPALILMAINLGRYGYPKRRAFWLSVTPILFLLFATMGWISPQRISQRDFALRMLAIWITYSQTIGLHHDWKALGKPAAPIWAAFLISLGTVLLMVGAQAVAWYFSP